MTKINTTFALDADIKLTEGKYQDAINICENGLQEYPNYPTAKFILANAYYLLGNKEKTNSIISEVEQQYPFHLGIAQLHELIKNDVINDKKLETEEVLIDDNNIDEIIDLETEKDELQEEADAEDKNELNIDEHLVKISEITSLIKNINEETNSKSDDISIEAENIPTNEALIDDNNIDEVIDLETKEDELQEEVDVDNAINIIEQENILTAEALINDNNIDEVIDLETKEDELQEEADVDNAINIIEQENILTEELEQVKVKDIKQYLPANNENRLSKELESIKNYNNEESQLKKLYSIDLNLSRSDYLSDSEFNEFKISHLQPNIDLPKLNFLIKDVVIENNDSAAPSKELELIDENQSGVELIENIQDTDLVTQEIIDLAKGIEGAQITLRNKIRNVIQEENNETPIVASETMAKIYVKQNKFAEAKQIYELLINEKPEKEEYWLEQIKKMESLI